MLVGVHKELMYHSIGVVFLLQFHVEMLKNLFYVINIIDGSILGLSSFLDGIWILLSWFLSWDVIVLCFQLPCPYFWNSFCDDFFKEEFFWMISCTQDQLKEAELFSKYVELIASFDIPTRMMSYG